MKWNQPQVEQFFGGKFERTEAENVIDMRFVGGPVTCWLVISWQDDGALISLAADIEKHPTATPLFELGFRCARIDLTEVSGMGPLLLFRASDSDDQDSIRLWVLRTRDGRFSISPHWPHEPAIKG
jgi:hypothetical protein